MNNPQQSGLSPKKPNTALVVLCCIFLPFVALILTWTLWKNAWDSKKKAIMTAILSAYTVIFLVAAFGGSSLQENMNDPITSSISEVTSENSEESSQTEDPEPTATPVPTEEPTPEPESEPEGTVPIIAGSNAYDMTVSLEEYKFPTATRTDISDGFQFDSMNSDYSYTIVTDKDYAISYAKCMALADNSDLLAFFATFPYDTMDQEAAQQWVKDNAGKEATTQIGDAIYTLSNGNQGAILEISAVGREEYLKEKLS